jgi:hypothetical protein
MKYPISPEYSNIRIIIRIIRILLVSYSKLEYSNTIPSLSFNVISLVSRCRFVPLFQV